MLFLSSETIRYLSKLASLFFRHLHLAIIHGYIQASKQLIDICQDSKYLDLRNDDGQVSIHIFILV